MQKILYRTKNTEETKKLVQLIKIQLDDLKDDIKNKMS